MFFDYAKLSNSITAKIKDVTGVDVSCYTRTLTGSGIRHSLGLHGEDGIRLMQYPNQLPVTLEELAKLPEVLENPDSIELSDETGPNGEQRIILKKLYGDHYVVIEEARPKRGKKKLALVTMWREENTGTPPNARSESQPIAERVDAPGIADNISQPDVGDNNGFIANQDAAPEDEI
jgi:hypothetical protein